MNKPEQETYQLCRRNCILFDFNKKVCWGTTPPTPARPRTMECLAPESYSPRHPDIQKAYEDEEKQLKERAEQVYQSSISQQVKRALDQLDQMPEPTDAELLTTIPAFILAKLQPVHRSGRVNGVNARSFETILPEIVDAITPYQRI